MRYLGILSPNSHWSSLFTVFDEHELFVHVIQGLSLSTISLLTLSFNRMYDV